MLGSRQKEPKNLGLLRWILGALKKILCPNHWATISGKKGHPRQKILPKPRNFAQCGHTNYYKIFPKVTCPNGIKRCVPQTKGIYLRH
jgi:hypothetical protein